MVVLRSVCVLICLALVTACGPGSTSSAGDSTPPPGTPAAYCAVMTKYKTRYLDQFATANAEMSNTQDAAGPIKGALYAVMAITDLAPMWSDMAKVAPPDIQQDTQRLADAWSKEMSNSVDNPLQPGQAIAKNMAVALTVLGPAMRVNSYVSQHC